MLDFRIGEKVRFHPDGHPELTGAITKYNKRTVTLITEGGQHCNVALPTRLDAGSPMGRDLCRNTALLAQT
jgi:hypothetical protein